MKLIRSTKSKLTKDENSENVPYLEITEVVLIIVINKIQEPCIHLFQISCLVNYQIFHPKSLYF